MFECNHKDTSQGLPNAIVRIEIGNEDSVAGITDSNGMAKIVMNAAYVAQFGRLIVEVNGYRKFAAEIEITGEGLPKRIALEPVP